MEKELGKAVSIPLGSEWELTIAPPKGWKTDNTGTTGAVIQFVSDLADYNKSGIFRSNINVMAERIENISKNQYCLKIKTKVIKSIPGYELIEDKNLKIGENTVCQLGGKFLAPGGVPIRNSQIIIVKKGLAITVTATCLYASWEDEKKLFKKVFNSVRVIHQNN